MPIYNQSTSMSRGGVAPSVQYNAAVRMPTQPMPDLPDVRSTFNIDLSAIGNAVAETERMKYTAQQEELDRKFRAAEAVKDFERNQKLKQMEIDAANERASEANDIAWYNAYTQRYNALKDKEKDNLQAITRIAKNWLQDELTKDAIDREAGNLTVDMQPLRDKEIMNKYQTMFGQYVPIVDIIDDTRKIFPGALTTLGIQEKAQTEAALEVKKEGEKKINEQAQTMSQINGLSDTENKKRIVTTQKEIQNFKDAMTVLRDPSATDEEKELASKQKEESLAHLGGELFSKHVNRNINNPAAYQQAREEFIKDFEPYMSRAEAENYWNIIDNKFGFTRTVEAVKKLDQDTLEHNQRAINSLIAKRGVKLLENMDGLATYKALHNVSPDLAEKFLDATNYDQLVDAMGARFGTTITDNKDGYYSVNYDGKSVLFGPDQVKSLKQSTGIEDFATAFNTKQAEVLVKKVNGSGDIKAVNNLNIAATPKNDSVAESITSTENMVNIATNLDYKTLLKMQKENPTDRGVNSMVATNKILNHFDSTKKPGDNASNGMLMYAKFQQKVHQIRVEKFIHPWIKGGRIEIRTDKEGKLDLYRDVSGVFGGVGYIECWKNIWDIEETLNSIPDLTAQEKVSFVETLLGQGNFYTYPTGETPGWKDYLIRAKDIVASAVATNTEALAIFETKLTDWLATGAAETTWKNVRDFTLKYIDKLDKSIEEDNKKVMDNPARTSSANAEINKPTFTEIVETLSENEKAKNKTPVPDGNEIITPVNLGGVVRKRSAVEVELPDAEKGDEDVIIAVTSD